MTAEEEKEGQNKGCLMSVWTKAQTSSFVEADSYNHIMQCIFSLTLSSQLIKNRDCDHGFAHTLPT